MLIKSTLGATSAILLMHSWLSTGTLPPAHEVSGVMPTQPVGEQLAGCPPFCDQEPGLDILASHPG